MNELIDKLENEMGLPFYFLERPEEQVNIICYRYTKEFVISDITKESSLYTFKFSLIVDKDINKLIDAVKSCPILSSAKGKNVSLKNYKIDKLCDEISNFKRLFSTLTPTCKL